MTACELLDQLIAPMRLGINASELHGSLTGFVCAGGNPGEQTWLSALHLQGTEKGTAEQVQPELERIAIAIRAALDPHDPGVELMLPAVDDGLEARALALLDWCRGFLGGFGLAGVDVKGLPSGMDEILRDFADIAATEPEFDDQEEDQAALAELVDHVRFGVLLLCVQLHAAKGSTRQ